MHPLRTAVESGDIGAAVALLADDVVFHSPVLYAPFEGRDAVAAVLRAVVRVLEDFRYVDELAAEDGQSHALVFKARVGDREVDGCDFLHANGAGLIDELTVMVRPLTGVIAIGEAMKVELAAGGAAAAG